MVASGTLFIETTNPCSVKYRRLAAICICTAVLTLAWVAATPSTAIPIGITVTEGESMGHDREGELLIYEAVTEPSINDTVVFYSETNREYVHHRIVDKDDEGYVTQGDANEITDVDYLGEYVTDDNYVGKAVVSI